MSGFESKQFIDLSEREENHLICNICLNIFNNAVNSECRHSFCRQCVQQWVDNNHKECPKCKQDFTSRKRSTKGIDGNDLILIGNYVFRRDFTANGIISELNIKCGFAYNGCQQSVKFGSLEAHLKLCEHRLCKTCGLDADPKGPHNCIEILKNAMNDWKLKYEKSEQQLKDTKEKYELGQNKEGQFKPSQHDIGFEINFNIDILLIGTYNTHISDIVVSCSGIRLINVVPNNSGTKFKYHILIPFKEMDELIYCSDHSFPVLIIRPDSSSCRKIQECLYLGAQSSPNGFMFDVNSSDQREKYIILVLKNGTLYQKCIETVVKNSKEVKSETKFESKDLITTRLMLEKAQNFVQTSNN